MNCRSSTFLFLLLAEVMFSKHVNDVMIIKVLATAVIFTTL